MLNGTTRRTYREQSHGNMGGTLYYMDSGSLFSYMYLAGVHRDLLLGRILLEAAWTLETLADRWNNSSSHWCVFLAGGRFTYLKEEVGTGPDTQPSKCQVARPPVLLRRHCCGFLLEGILVL